MKADQITAEKVTLPRALSAFAAERGQTLAQLALTFVMHQPAATGVPIGASSPAQVKENAAFTHAAPLTETELQKIENILQENA